MEQQRGVFEYTFDKHLFPSFMSLLTYITWKSYQDQGSERIPSSRDRPVGNRTFSPYYTSIAVSIDPGLLMMLVGDW